MSRSAINLDMQGGAVGIAGAHFVRVENLYVGELVNQASAEQSNVPVPRCPYPGLVYFGPRDALNFFGRAKTIEALAASVTAKSFTALVGSSGSGKSSVVLAGLVPKLDAKGNWRSSYFRIGTEPDKNPFSAIARALVPLSGELGLSEKLEEVQKLADKLESGSIKLITYLGQCRVANPGKRLLVIADQFEEVFTLIPDELRRKHFIDMLISAFPDPQLGTFPEVSLALTIRADFFNAALRYRPLADKLQNRVENLGPMTRDELSEAIIKPAERLTPPVTFEPGLVGTVLDDVERRPGSLPLLQFALREMWLRLTRPVLTRSEYDAIGGVEGALAMRAQSIFENVTNKGQDSESITLFRQLFTRLVALGEGSEDTRRTVARDELSERAWALAQQLAGEGNRLVVTALTTAGQETVEVAHEALIRNWPTLIDWVARDRAFIAWRNHLKQRLDDWRKDPDDDSALLRGSLLSSAEDWNKKRGDELNEEEKTFIAKGVEFRLRAVKEDEQKHRVARRAAQMSIIAALLICGICVGLIWSNWTYIIERAMISSEILWPRVLSDMTEHSLKAGDHFVECIDCPEMVAVPAGRGLLGSSKWERERNLDEGPQVSILFAKPFAVASAPVTFDQWDFCVTMGGCDYRPSDQGWGRGTHPVINIRWDDAQQYVRWLSLRTGKVYRLLSESEYEYAARARTVTRYSWGNEIGVGFANCNKCGSKWDLISTAPIRSFAPNGFGLYDMEGNVWTWVQDCYEETLAHESPIGMAATTPDCANHVVRGGAWYSDPDVLRVANRGKSYLKRLDGTGLRVARTLSVDTSFDFTNDGP